MMKINEPNRINGLLKYGNAKNIRTGASEGLRRKDEVSISPEAKELLETNRASDPERAGKIADLKESVSSGTYYVEAGKIAEKLLPYLKNYNKD